MELHSQRLGELRVAGAEASLHATYAVASSRKDRSSLEYKYTQQ